MMWSILHYLYAWHKTQTSQHGDKSYSLYPKGWESTSRTMDTNIFFYHLSSLFLVWDFVTLAIFSNKGVANREGVL